MNAVSTSRETFSNSLRTNSAPTAVCSRSSTRAPISIASETTRAGFSPASIRRSRNAAVAGSSTTTFSTITRPIRTWTRGWRRGVAASMRRRHGTRRPRRNSPARYEAGEALGRLLVHLDARDVGVPRPAAHELDHRRDRLGRALEHRLDRALGRVARPPATAAALRLPARRVAEEDSLHTAVGDDSPACRRACRYGREMTALEVELDACGGAAAPPSAIARLREVLAEALRTGRAELAKPRSGYDDAGRGRDRRPATATLLAALPVPAALRADPEAAAEREWLLVAAVVGTLVELAEPGAPLAPADLQLRAGELPGGFLVLAYPASGARPEFVGLAFDEQADADRPPARPRAGAAAGRDRRRRAARADRRRATRCGSPRPSRGSAGTRPTPTTRSRTPCSPARPGGAAVRPHEDPDPGLRAARRILQRLDGMGKWGGYHTEFAHLAARLRRQRPRARAGGGGGAAGGRAAGREAAASASATSTSTRAGRPRSAG